jgi:hypothetical protein
MEEKLPTKYRATWLYEFRIEACKVVKETPKQIVYMKDCSRYYQPNHEEIMQERREAKESRGIKWFDTWEEAHTTLLSIAQKRVDSARVGLDDAKGKLGNVKGMREVE